VGGQSLPERIKDLLPRRITRNQVILILLMIMGGVVRWIILPSNFPTPDLRTWFWTGMIAVRKPGGLFNLYKHMRLYAYPPLWIFFCSLAYLIHPWYRCDQRFSMLIKLPIAIADLITGLIVYLMVSERSDSRRGTVAATLYVMNMHVVFVSSFWGMFDGLVALLLASCVYLFHKDRKVSAGILAGLSLLAKQSALPLILVLAFIAFRKKWSKGTKFLLALTIIFLAVSMPFLLSTPEDFVSALYYDRPQLDLRGRTGALWYTFRAFELVPNWLERNHFYVFYASLFFPILLLRQRETRSIYDLSEISVLSFMNFYTFTPQLHTTYLILMMPFLCVLIAGGKISSLWYLVPIFWSEGFYYYIAQRLSPISTEYSYYTVVRAALLFGFFVYLWMRMLKKTGETKEAEQDRFESIG